MVRKVTKEDIEYIQQQKFAFVKVSTTSFGEVDLANKINQTISLTSLMGLTVLYEYGENQAAMFTSLGYSREEAFDDDQVLPPKAAAEDEPKYNSHRQQIFKTAGEMILLALEQGWQTVKVEEGSDLFKWSIWAFSKANGLKVEGYEPDEDGLAAYERCETLIDPYVYQKTQSYAPGLGATESYDQTSYKNLDNYGAMDAIEETPNDQASPVEETEARSIPDEDLGVNVDTTSENIVPPAEPSKVEPDDNKKESPTDTENAEKSTITSVDESQSITSKDEPTEPPKAESDDNTNESPNDTGALKTSTTTFVDESQSIESKDVASEPKANDSANDIEQTEKKPPQSTDKSPVVGFSQASSKVTPIKKPKSGGLVDQQPKTEDKPFSFNEESLTEEEIKELRELEKKDQDDQDQ